MHNKQFSSYIIKLTGGCNLGCPYCYYFGGTPRVPNSRLDINLIFQLMTQASQHSDFVELIWHGGEPLMVGIEFFKNIIACQTKISKKHGTHFRNLVQTNGTLLNRHWINLFKDADPVGYFNSILQYKDSEVRFKRHEDEPETVYPNNFYVTNINPFYLNNTQPDLKDQVSITLISRPETTLFRGDDGYGTGYGEKQYGRRGW